MITLKRYLLGVVACCLMTIGLLYIMIYHKVQNLGEHSAALDSEPNEVEMKFLDYDDYNAYEDGEYIQPLLEEDVLRIDTKMAERREWAESACKRLGEDGSKVPNGWEFLVNYDHQLIWCNVFKAASTNWFSNFMAISGHKLEDYLDLPPVEAVRLVYHRPTGEELVEAHQDPDSLAFIIVRHPFERLSSAYRDKIQNAVVSDYYGELSENIVKKYRRKTPERDNKEILQDSTPTFEEFVRFVLHEAKHNQTLDMHWVPYSKFCTPCQMHFDIIMKMETLEEDQDFLIHKAVLEEYFQPTVMNAGSEKRVEHGRETHELLPEHFSQLTKSQIQQLYELYIYDFEIFNYTMDEYFDMTSREEDPVPKKHFKREKSQNSSF